MKHNIPNIISTSRILLTFLFLYLYLNEGVEIRMLGVLVFAIAAISDFFDGYFARKYDVSSSFGIFLDPLADKFLTMSGFITLPILFPNLFAWWAIILILLRDIFITLLRLWAERKKMTLETSYSAKVKTMIQMLFLYVALLFGGLYPLDVPIINTINYLLFDSGFLTIVMYLVTLITVYTGFEYIFANKQIFKWNQ